jgi:hypothetical protein
MAFAVDDIIIRVRVEGQKDLDDLRRAQDDVRDGADGAGEGVDGLRAGLINLAAAVQLAQVGIQAFRVAGRHRCAGERCAVRHGQGGRHHLRGA